MHTTNVVVWDVPTAVVAGEKFRIKVGIKCADECSLANTSFEIFDHEGARRGAGTLGSDRWPGTTALYAAEVELPAPAREGLYDWNVKGPSAPLEPSEPDHPLPHAEATVDFGVRVVPRPDYVVTVEAIDPESQTPLKGARVVMPPYRAITDDRGVAQVRVAKGTYMLFVSQTGYRTFGTPLDVSDDATAKVELSLEPVLERN